MARRLRTADLLSRSIACCWSEFDCVVTVKIGAPALADVQAGVTDDGGKFCEECLESVVGRAVVVLPTGDLRFRCGRALDRRHRILGGLSHLVVIGEE